MTFPGDAWILRRLLADLPLNGELDTMTGALKRMAGHLAEIPLEGRQPAWKTETGTWKTETGTRLGKTETGARLGLTAIRCSKTETGARLVLTAIRCSGARAN